MVNLFLVNPSGITFGPKAKLDVGGVSRGSFVATTLDAFVWPNGAQFSATNPEGADRLLTLVGDPSGFMASLRQPESIESLGSNLLVYKGQTLLLVGGNVTLKGGLLQAEGGRVELGGVAGSGMVGLDVDNNLRLRFPNEVARTDIHLSNSVEVVTNGEGGGEIRVQGKRVQLTDGSRLLAETLGGKDGREISIQASELIIRDGSQMSTSTFSTGRGGGFDCYRRGLRGTEWNFSA